jgi:hypothetical protein
MKIIIQGELPSTNEIIAYAKQHYQVYRRVKAEYTDLVAMEAIAQKIRKVDAAEFIFTWYMKNNRKDKDNISGGQKFFF